jgi:hypothetical protein
MAGDLGRRPEFSVHTPSDVHAARGEPLSRGLQLLAKQRARARRRAVRGLAATLLVFSCGSKEEPAQEPGAAAAAATWGCEEFEINFGATEWFCSCGTEANPLPLGDQPECYQSSYPCCVADSEGTSCVCDYTDDCEDKASFLGETQVPSCPPPSGTDLTAGLPGEGEPVCQGGRMSCNGGTPRCDGVPGSCPRCTACLDANLDAACVSRDDQWEYVGVPVCGERFPQSTASPENAEPACVLTQNTFFFDDSEPISLFGFICVETGTEAQVDSYPTCAMYGEAVPVCDAFRVSCALFSERELPPGARTPLGPAACERL